MKQILKRTGALLLSLCLTLSVWGVLTPLPAAAETSGDYRYFVNNDNTATITDYSGSGGDITIPDTLDGHTVTEIGAAFVRCTKLTSVTIPNSVTKIGSSAFYGCTGLTSVDIPDSVTEIGNGAFEGCTGLTSVIIPDSVTEIGYYAFRDCTGLTSVDIGNGVTTINNDVFYHCTGLTSVNIPDSVTKIGNYAFYGCTGLTSVTIPDSVTWIVSSAFSGCSGLTSFTVGANNPNYSSKDGVLFDKSQTELMRYPQGKSGSYTIPNSVTEIGNIAFSGCTGLTSVIIPDNVTDIGMNAFDGCTGLTSVDIPDSVTMIYPSAFYGCTGLVSVTIGDSVTTIGTNAFDGCTGLTSVNIPDSVTVISDSIFRNCTGLTSVIIPDSVTRIIHHAFQGCTGLTSIIIPASVADIGWDAFSGCDNLTIYGFAGSEVERYAKENNIPFVAISRLSDDATGIVVQGAEEAIPEGATLTAKQTASGEDTATYEITLTQNGQPIQPTGEVTVKIPLPESMKNMRITVYRIEANGSRTNMNATVQNGCAVFTTDHFSQYLLEAKIMPADYTAVDAALAKVPEDLSGYTAETAQAVKDAVAAVERDLPITEQAKVDAMAKAIEDAVAKLQYKAADYTAVDAALAKVPEDLSGYTDETAQAVKDAVAAVERDLPITEQAQVDAMAKAIEDAIAKLQYKAADYTAVDAALQKVPEDLSVYTDSTAQAVKDAVAAVERDLPITEQAKVDAMAKAIEDAIAKLQYKAADYTAVDAALAKVPEDLSGYTAETAQAVKDAVAAVERDLPITEQAKVNAMAKAIEDAVAALQKAEKPTVLGDIDGDGKVSVTDALAILRMAVGLSTPVDNADIDGMNGVTVTDALAALRIAVGLA